MNDCSTPSHDALPGEPVPTDNPYEKANAPKFTFAETEAGKKGLPRVLPDYLPLHACMGLNSCKGSDRYGLTGPNGTDPNDCAGQGYCATTADHTCHTQNDCANQGGCGLYGSGEEMNHPAKNECRSMGSCATPINAERFTTSGPNKGKSVWVRAREVFKEDWPEHRAALAQKKEAGELPADYDLPPEQLGDVPAPFQGTGPSYLWISDDNTERGNMTSCGASGLSGAGGCG